MKAIDYEEACGHRTVYLVEVYDPRSGDWHDRGFSHAEAEAATAKARKLAAAGDAVRVIRSDLTYTLFWKSGDGGCNIATGCVG